MNNQIKTTIILFFLLSFSVNCFFQHMENSLTEQQLINISVGISYNNGLKIGFGCVYSNYFQYTAFPIIGYQAGFFIGLRNLRQIYIEPHFDMIITALNIGVNNCIYFTNRIIEPYITVYVAGNIMLAVEPFAGISFPLKKDLKIQKEFGVYLQYPYLL